MRDLAKTIAAILAVVLFAFAGWYLYDTFRERTMPEKLARIIHLEDQRYLTGELEAFLEDDSTRVRARAALAVGRIDHPESGELLMPLLEDPSIDVAGTAAFALGLTSDKELAGRLLDMAEGLPSVVAAQAITSAGRLADSSMSDVAAGLLGFLEHPSADVREAACFALFYAGARGPAEELVAFEESEPDSLVRIAALYTLARLGIETASPLFVKYQADSDPFARMLAVRGLGASNSPDRLRLLALSLNDSDARVTAQAIAGLVATQDAKAAQYIAGKLARITDEKLIIAAIDALRSLKSEQGLETAMMHLRSGLSGNITSAGVRYVAAVRKGRAVGLIDSLLHGRPTPQVRAACAEAYGEINTENVVSRVAVLFADEDPLVRGAAFGVLIELDSANLQFYLDKALADPDPMPVVLALDQIGQDGLTAYLPAMVAMMARGGEVDVDVRRTIIDAAVAFYDKLGSDTTLMELLVSGLFDPEYVVRRQTAEAYRDKLNENRLSLVSPAATRISERKIRQAIEQYQRNPYALIVTSKGEIEFEMYFDVAPLTVLNFMELAEDGFYDGLTFHRVVPNFVIQGGDPRGDGWGGPPYFIRCEYSDEPYIRGTVGIATSGKDTGGSQFFITHSPQPRLEARYTVFGQVTGGFDVVDRIVKGDVIEKIIIRES